MTSLDKILQKLVAKTEHLNLRHIAVLHFVATHECEATSPRFVARHFDIPKGAVTKTINGLVDRGLVVRVPGEVDRRDSFARVTAEGKALIGPLMALERAALQGEGA